METNIKSGMNKSPETDINSEDDGKQYKSNVVAKKRFQCFM